MEKGSEDIRIDPRLDKQLYHRDLGRFQSHNDREEETVADSLPEWLIGVIVVIIVLVLLFFIMVISTIIKKKRKCQSTNSGASNSSIHACDDLELGKITMIDIDTKTTLVESDDKNLDTDKDVVLTSQRRLSEPVRSPATNGSPMCTYRNPLFVDDDDPHKESKKDETVCTSPNKETACLDAEMGCYKSLENPNRHNIVSEITELYNIKCITDMQEKEEEHLGGCKDTETKVIETDFGSQNHNQTTLSISPHTSTCIPEQVLDANQSQINNSSKIVARTGDKNNQDELKLDNGNATTNRHTTDTDGKGIAIECNSSSKENLTEYCRNEDNASQAHFPETAAIVVEESSKMKVVESKEKNKNKSQRFSFVRIKLNGDDSDLENIDRNSTKL